MHRGAAGFMSDKQFAKFYWPGFKALILGLIDAGLTPVPLFEGDYTSRLEYLTELPPGKVVGHFDHIDRKKAKKLLGDIMCFWGNVPASLMCTGTPQQIKDDVKELIDIFGDNGGLIIDSTMGLMSHGRRMCRPSPMRCTSMGSIDPDRAPRGGQESRDGALSSKGGLDAPRPSVAWRTAAQGLESPDHRGQGTKRQREGSR